MLNPQYSFSFYEHDEQLKAARARDQLAGSGGNDYLRSMLSAVSFKALFKNQLVVPCRTLSDTFSIWLFSSVVGDRSVPDRSQC